MHVLKLVWIVDDDPIFTFLSKTLLTKHGICDDVETFTHGAVACERLASIDRASVPDLILLDINMPVMDGWEFLNKIHPLYPSLGKPLHIIMLSSTIDPDELELARQHPELLGFLGKPLGMKELRAMIDQVRPPR